MVETSKERNLRRRKSRFAKRLEILIRKELNSPHYYISSNYVDKDEIAITAMVLVSAARDDNSFLNASKNVIESVFTDNFSLLMENRLNISERQKEQGKGAVKCLKYSVTDVPQNKDATPLSSIVSFYIY